MPRSVSQHGSLRPTALSDIISTAYLFVILPNQLSNLHLVVTRTTDTVNLLGYHGNRYSYSAHWHDSVKFLRANLTRKQSGFWHSCCCQSDFHMKKTGRRKILTSKPKFIQEIDSSEDSKLHCIVVVWQMWCRFKQISPHT